MDIKEWLAEHKIDFNEKYGSNEITIYSKNGIAIARIFPDEDKFILDIALQNERYGIDNNFKPDILDIFNRLQIIHDTLYSNHS